MTYHGRSWVPFLLVFLVFLRRWCEVSAVDVYIDDEYGDPATGLKPIYSPSGAWVQGNTCSESTCPASIDSSELKQLYEGTYHYADGDLDLRTITLKFSGTSFAVFCVLANNASFGSGTHLTFTLDSESVGDFDHDVPIASDNEFNYRVYLNSSIHDGNHTFVIAITPEAGIIFFDYATYTPSGNATSTASSANSSDTQSPGAQSNPTSSSPASSATGTASNSSNNANNPQSSKRLGVILAGVLGGVGGAGAFAALFWFWRRRRHGNKGQDGHQAKAPTMTAPEMSISHGAEGTSLAIASAPLLATLSPNRNLADADSATDDANTQDTRSQSTDASDRPLQRWVVANPSAVPDPTTSPSERPQRRERSRARLVSEKARLVHHGHTQAVPHVSTQQAQASSSDPEAGGSGSGLDTNARIAALAAEVERLRDERETERVMQEAPPRYDG